MLAGSSTVSVHTTATGYLAAHAAHAAVQSRSVAVQDTCAQRHTNTRKGAAATWYCDHQQKIAQYISYGTSYVSRPRCCKSHAPIQRQLHQQQVGPAVSSAYSPAVLGAPSSGPSENSSAFFFFSVSTFSTLVALSGATREMVCLCSEPLLLNALPDRPARSCIVQQSYFYATPD